MTEPALASPTGGSRTKLLATILLLGLMFVLAILPTGLAMRAFGKDPMARKLGKEERYWVKRKTATSSSETLAQPF